jgi:hypothetical protein
VIPSTGRTVPPPNGGRTAGASAPVIAAGATGEPAAAAAPSSATTSCRGRRAAARIWATSSCAACPATGPRPHRKAAGTGSHGLPVPPATRNQDRGRSGECQRHGGCTDGLRRGDGGRTLAQVFELSSAFRFRTVVRMHMSDMGADEMFSRVCEAQSRRTGLFFSGAPDNSGRDRAGRTGLAAVWNGRTAGAAPALRRFSGCDAVARDDDAAAALRPAQVGAHRLPLGHLHPGLR